MEWVEDESFGLGSPAFADELVWRQAFEGLQSSPEVVGADKVGEMPFELVVVVVVEAFNGCVLDRAVHAFDLAIRPRMLRFGCPVLDAERRAGIFEGVRPDGFALRQGFDNERCCRSARTGRSEMGAIIGQHDVDLVRHGFDKMAQKVGGGLAKSLAMQLDEGEFARAIDGHEEVEPAFRRLNLGNVDMEEANRVGFELLFRRQIAVHIGKTADPIPLQAPMQR